MIQNMDTALQDVELECAFAIFYFVGEPMAELAEHSASAEGVIGWAKAKHPTALARMVVGVCAVVRGTLEQMADTQARRARALVNPQIVALAEQESAAREASGAGSLNPMCVTPESGVEWEQPMAPCYQCGSTYNARSPCPLCHKVVCADCADGPPRNGSTCCDDEAPSLNNPDGSEDFEVKP